jgi:DNA repair exonuclease SbcCD ATPase subunit
VTFLELRKRADKVLARREILSQQLASSRERVASIIESEQDHVDALPIILKIGQLHRQFSLDKIESLVTSALRVVFEHPYTFKLRQEEKRGQIELVPIVIDGDLELEPASSMGGGIIDVLSIALRIILWSMMKDKPESVMVMDEPARHVNSEKSVKNLATLFEQVSKSMGLQFIVVTNRPALSHNADLVYKVRKSKGSSVIEKSDG